jgi:hypothetical protein
MLLPLGWSFHLFHCMFCDPATSVLPQRCVWRVAFLIQGLLFWSFVGTPSKNQRVTSLQGHLKIDGRPKLHLLLGS